MKFNTGYTDYSDDDLAGLGEKVGQAAKDVPALAGIIPNGTTILAAAKALRDAMIHSGLGRPQAIAAARVSLGSLLKDFAYSVDHAPGMTDEIRAMTRLPIAKVGVHHTAPPEQLQDLRLSHSDKQGEVVAHCRAQNNVRMILSQWTLDPSSVNWTDGPHFPSTRHMIIPGLPRGKDVWIRLAAEGAHGQGPWSDPATIMVT